MRLISEDKTRLIPLLRWLKRRGSVNMKNLYGTEKHNDIYDGYDHKRYIHFRNVPTGEFETTYVKRNGKEIPVRKEIYERKEIKFDNIKKINLDNFGVDVRTHGEHFTMIHNYLMDFWIPIIGKNAALVYIAVKRYCFGLKDFCYPDMETISQSLDLSRPTLNKAMDVLEEHGFIVKIFRYDKEANNSETTPLIKIRRFVPLLTEDLIDLLPHRVKENHNKFLATLNGVYLDEKIKTQEMYDILLDDSKSINNRKKNELIQNLKKEGLLRESIIASLTPKELQEWEKVSEIIKGKIAKPSYDVWFKNSIIKIDSENKRVTLITPNRFVRENITSKHIEFLKEAASAVIDDSVLITETLVYEDMN